MCAAVGPAGPRDALPLAAQLIRARPALATPLLQRLLLQDTAAAAACAGAARMTRSGEDGGSSSDGGVSHPDAVRASDRPAVSCLEGLLRAGSGAAVAELVDAAGGAGTRLRGAGRRRGCLAAVAACAAQCLACSPAATQEAGWSAAVRASCRALAGLLAAGPDPDAPPGQPPTEEAAAGAPSASRVVREAQPLLQSVSLALRYATARAMQLLQSEQQQQQQQQGEETGAMAAAGEGGGSPARELFQSCCLLRLQLASAGVTEVSSSPGTDAFHPPAPAANGFLSTGGEGDSTACSCTQRPWQEAVLLQRPSKKPTPTEPTDAQHGQSSDCRATVSENEGGNASVGEDTVGEALLRALPGRRRCLVQLELQSLCTDSRSEASHAFQESVLGLPTSDASGQHPSLVCPGAEPASIAGRMRLEASSQAPLAAAPPYSALQVRNHPQTLLSAYVI